jgi:hypothetical protein
MKKIEVAQTAIGAGTGTENQSSNCNRTTSHDNSFKRCQDNCARVSPFQHRSNNEKVQRHGYPVAGCGNQRRRACPVKRNCTPCHIKANPFHDRRPAESGGPKNVRSQEPNQYQIGETHTQNRPDRGGCDRAITKKKQRKGKAENRQRPEPKSQRGKRTL